MEEPIKLLEPGKLFDHTLTIGHQVFHCFSLTSIFFFSSFQVSPFDISGNIYSLHGHCVYTLTEYLPKQSHISIIEIGWTGKRRHFTRLLLIRCTHFMHKENVLKERVSQLLLFYSLLLSFTLFSYFAISQLGFTLCDLCPPRWSY